jgi:hypothetical protein
VIGGFQEPHVSADRNREHPDIRDQWSRFNTWVTQMVQDIGNTLACKAGEALRRLEHAVETDRCHEPENGVCA